MAERVVFELQSKRTHCRIMTDLTQAEQHLDVGKRLDARFQERAALVDFSPNRFVLRRHAPHGIGDHCVFQAQPVIGAPVVGPLTKAELVQRGIEKIAGPIPSERSSCAVGSGHSWSQTDHQQLGVFISKTWDRAIEPIGF